MATNQLSYLDKPVALVHTGGAVWGTGVFPSYKTANVTTYTPSAGEREKLSNKMQAGGGGFGTVFQASNFMQQDWTLEMDFTYNSEAALQIMAAFYGQYSSTVNSGVRTHVGTLRKKVTPAQTEDSLFSFWYKEGEELKYIPSSCVTSLTLIYDAGQLKLRADFIGDKLYTGTATQIANMENLGFPTDVTGPYPTFADCWVRMNNAQDVVGDPNVALSSSDEVNPVSLELTFSRPLVVKDIPAGSDAIGMPVDTSTDSTEMTVALGFTFKDAVSAAYFSKHQAATSYKVEIQFTSPNNIPGKAVPYEFNLRFPRLQVNAPEYTVDETGVSATFTAVEAVAVPAGMSSVYPTFILVNTISAQTFPA